MRVPKLLSIAELPIKHVGFSKEGQMVYELVGMLNSDIIQSLSAHGLQGKNQVVLSDDRVLDFAYVVDV